MLDDWVDIRWADAVVPFRAGYRPLWTGLGTVAALLVTAAVTAAARRFLPLPLWRRTHYLTHAAWPVAVVHGLGAGSDRGSPGAVALTLACVALVTSRPCCGSPAPPGPRPRWGGVVAAAGRGRAAGGPRRLAGHARGPCDEAPGRDPAGPAATLAEHLAVHGALPADRSRAGRRGRGQRAHRARRRRLPAGRQDANRPGRARLRGRPVVVVNAAESEPAADKDASLVTRAPHLVLDGAGGRARAVGAREVVVWVHRGAARAGQPRDGGDRASVGRADSLRVEVVAGPDRYVAGEASAIVRHLSGGPALPTCRRTAPPSAASGAGPRCSPTRRRSRTSGWSPGTAPPGSAPPACRTSPGRCWHGARRRGAARCRRGAARAPLAEALEACGGPRRRCARCSSAGTAAAGSPGRRPHRDADPGVAGGPRRRPRHRAAAGPAGRPLPARGDRAAGRLAGRRVGRAVRPVRQRAARHRGRPHGAGDRRRVACRSWTGGPRWSPAAARATTRTARSGWCARRWRSSGRTSSSTRAGPCPDLDCSPVAPLPAHAAVAGAAGGDERAAGRRLDPVPGPRAVRRAAARGGHPRRVGLPGGRRPAARPGPAGRPARDACPAVALRLEPRHAGAGRATGGRRR